MLNFNNTIEDETFIGYKFNTFLGVILNGDYTSNELNELF